MLVLRSRKLTESEPSVPGETLTPARLTPARRGDRVITQVKASDGVRLAVQEHGSRSKPTLVAVHGYPDNHTIWDRALPDLTEHYHVVTYDMRGAGDSDAPRERKAYQLDRVADDFVAVLNAVAPDQPVHLVAHDWGSIQAWHAITTGRVRDRIASFTSMGGPCLHHAGYFFRSRLRRPTVRGLRDLTVQALSSSYILFFRIPVIPELCWRLRLVPGLIRSLEFLDRNARGNPHKPDWKYAIRGLELYRANTGQLLRPQQRYADLPVQVIAATGDPYVTPAVQTDIRQWVPDLHVQRVSGGHWLTRTHPAVVAHYVHTFIQTIETRTPKPQSQTQTHDHPQ